MEKDKDLLEAILKDLPQDEDWDVTIPREKAFKDSGEKRYLYKSTDMLQVKTTTTDTDKLTGGGETSDKKALKDFASLLLARPRWQSKWRTPKLST